VEDRRRASRPTTSRTSIGGGHPGPIVEMDFERTRLADLVAKGADEKGEEVGISAIWVAAMRGRRRCNRLRALRIMCAGV
jgi:hypothetical protein